MRNAALGYLYALQYRGIKAGLKNITALLDGLGHPERRFPTVHIAGTNGKGSTAAMIASVLTAAGYRTGLYTSPHLVRFNERIRINGRPISDEEIVSYAISLKKAIERTGSTFFEATTAIAFRYFADRDVDIAVVETGLGGRWDATNVVTPLVSIITTIDFDHMEYLGSTLTQIAAEKGGIIKSGIPCFTAVDAARATTTLARIARARKAALHRVDRESSIAVSERFLDGSTVTLQTPQGRYANVFLSLAGDHQTRNMQLAVRALEYLDAHCSFRTRTRVGQGLARIRRYTGFRGRLELLSSRPMIIVDAAHNAAGIKTAAFALQSLTVGKGVVVFGVMRDKEVGRMITRLKPIARLVLAVAPRVERALSSLQIVNELHRHAVPALDAESVAEGIRLALGERRENEPVVIIGSHYVLGEAIELIESGI